MEAREDGAREALEREDGAWEASERAVALRTDSGGSLVTSVTSQSSEAALEGGAMGVLVSKYRFGARLERDEIEEPGGREFRDRRW